MNLQLTNQYTLINKSIKKHTQRTLTNKSKDSNPTRKMDKIS